ncbi:hypothetical protein [Desulfovibrio sp. JC022]|uniref:hypothetical protein n=1 Tax=Desulfovibrio sp. JC022 TaxID=2593642 RepID=UPI0013D46687|nr:hypothetical protein [Desulfovibrio sp. JC022]NDV24814.1 hypothetical protein [Desulfovibrio sp. JC022]
MNLKNNTEKKDILKVFSQTIDLMKNIAIIATLAAIFINSDLIETYIYSERVKLLKTLPFVKMTNDGYEHYFHTHKPDWIAIYKTTLTFCNESKQETITVQNKTSIEKAEVIKILNNIGGLNGSGVKKTKVFVTFETSLGQIDGSMNPYIFEYKINSRGGYDSPMFYRDGVFNIINF